MTDEKSPVNENTSVEDVVPSVPEPTEFYFRAIDWMRPDHAYLRGVSMPHVPKPYEERIAHQGKRETERRLKRLQKSRV